MAAGIDKTDLLRGLEPIEPDHSADAGADASESMSLARALHTLAELGANPAFKLSRAVADHVLDRVPEPPAIEE